MLLYILDSANRLKSCSESLDAKTALCDKAWVVFNADGKKQVWKFRRDGTMSITINGEFEIRKWMYDSSDNSINIMTSETTGICIKPSLFNGYLLGLHQDGTNHKLAMIDEKHINDFVEEVTYAVLSKKIDQLEKVAYYQTEKWGAEQRKREEVLLQKKAENERQEQEKKILEQQRLNNFSKEMISKFKSNLSWEEFAKIKEAKSWEKWGNILTLSFIPIFPLTIYVSFTITSWLFLLALLSFVGFVTGMAIPYHLLASAKDKYKAFIESQSLSESEIEILLQRFSLDEF